MGNRRQVRAIRFDEDAISRNAPRDFRERLSFRKRDDAGVRNIEAEIDDVVRKLVARREAMDHSTRRCLGLEKSDRVVVGISCVDDHRQIELLRYRQLPAEYFALNIAWRIVVVVIEAGFADRQHARMPDELFHQAVMPFFDFRSIVWMDTGACIDPVVFFGDWNSTSHLVGTTAVSDRQYLSDSRIPGALEYGIAIVVK